MFRKKESFGIIILIAAWELLIYVTCEYFFPTKIFEKVYTHKQSYYSHQDGSVVSRHQRDVMDWVDYFNEDLFQALNIVGLALLLIFIAYKLIKNRE